VFTYTLHHRVLNSWILIVEKNVVIFSQFLDVNSTLVGFWNCSYLTCQLVTCAGAVTDLVGNWRTDVVRSSWSLKFCQVLVGIHCWRMVITAS